MISFICWEVIGQRNQFNSFTADKVKFVGKLDSICVNEEIYKLLGSRPRKDRTFYIICEYVDGQYTACVKVAFYNDSQILIEAPTEDFQSISNEFHRTHSVKFVC